MAIFFALLIGGIYEFLSLRGVVNIVCLQNCAFWRMGDRDCTVIDFSSGHGY